MSSPTSIAGLARDQVPLIAEALRKYEHSLAAARADASSLVMSLLYAQLNANVTPTTGHQIFAAITASQAGLDQALSQADLAHRLAEALGKRLGVEVTGYGEQKDAYFAPKGSVDDPALVSA